MALNRSQILSNAPTLKTKEVNVPEWGGTVIVRELNGAELKAYVLSIVPSGGGEFRPDDMESRAKLLVAALVDDEGKPMFTLDDLDFLMNKVGGSIFLNLANVALTLNGLGVSSITEAKDNLKNAR